MADYLVQKDVSVPMRDGARLAADIYRPAAPGRYPVLLARTAYDKSSSTTGTMLNALRAAEEGYAVVVQDCRGRYQSEGTWVPFECEIDDGYDTVEWCAAQEWSDGAVGMYGMSYVGATVWLAAISAPPHLRCIFPVMTAADYHDGWIYIGGAFNLAFTAAWTAQFLAAPHAARLGLPPEEAAEEQRQLLASVERLRRHVSGWPLAEMPLLAREGLAPYYYDWLQRPAYDARWERINISANHHRITVPAFSFGGWYDLFLAGPPRNFAGLRKNAATGTARNGPKLLIGPWTHNSPAIAQVGQRNFGPGATLALEDLQLRWFNHWLRGIDTGLLDEPPVRIYVMNDGWRDEQEWPLARTQDTPYYLHSAGRAQGLRGDGTLSTQLPAGREASDLFLYNPESPVGTIGAAGINDQRAAEERTDVLVYTTPPLAKPVEVTGAVRLVLHASTSATDTDWVARLVDVSPEGYAANLCEGILRASYRGSRAEAQPLEPGHVYEFQVDMLMTSNLFRAGHRIRLEVTSSCFPKFDRNPNTGEPAALARAPQPALQAVYHDAPRPSHVLLPVIPQE